ncbi:BatD family protein [Aliidiomarina sp. Khilg15.8]
MVTTVFNRVLILALLMCSAPALAITLQASVDKNPVIANESFTLTIAADEDIPRAAFRSEQLLDDFVVGATSVDRSTRLIQGQMSRQTRWQVTLVARQPGTYQIPSFSIEGAQTQPIELEVVAASPDDGDRGPVFLTATLDNQTPYVQQQIRYEVKLHLAQTLESGSISPPQLDNADIQQLGRDEDREEVVDGQRYRVISRTYLITPRRSGDFTLQGSRFDGQVRDANARGFASFSRPQSVTALAPEVELRVKAQPPEYTGRWLPSQQVVLEDELEQEQRFQVGEPVTRRITLTAEGVREDQLPDLDISYPDSLRFYPERTQRESFNHQGERIAQATFNGVFIPTEAGTYELPAVEVPWWNINTDTLQTARLPAREITVHEPAGGVASPTAVDTGPTAGASPEPRSPTIILPTGQTSLWSWLTTLFALLWLLTLILCGWLWFKPRQPQAKVKSSQVPAPSRKPLQQLKLACRKNDAPAAREALLAWANSRLPGAPAYHDLDSLSAALENDTLTEQTAHLQRALYAGRQETWEHGDALWQAIQQLHVKDRQPASDSGLPSLYPLR